MAKQVQMRGGTTAETAAFLGVEREVTVDTTKDSLVVHDGLTLGGHPVANSKKMVAGFYNYALDTGSTNAFVVSLSENPGVYTEGMHLRFKAAWANSGACTLNVNGMGVKSVVSASGSAPAAGDIAAGQIVEVVYDGTNFVALKNFSQAATASDVFAGTNNSLFVTPLSAEALRGHGECYLTLSSGSLLLKRVGQGRVLFPSGLMVQVPVSGISLSPASSTPGTTYNIYLTTGLALEYSATAYAIDSSTGIAMKTGDNTRVLVGMARSVTGPAWQDDSITGSGAGTLLGVISYYNRKEKILTVADSGSSSTNSTAYIVGSSSVQGKIITWSDEIVKIQISANLNPTANNIYLKAGVDSSVVGFETVCWGQTEGILAPSSTIYNAFLSEGYHTVDTYFKVNTGTAQIFSPGSYKYISVRG